MFLGDELTAVLEALEEDKPYEGAEKTVMKLGVKVLPKFPRDTTDRNRTSPFAFTGNKFEFRMLGSSNSIACTNIMLNTAVAESLRQYADALEGAEDFNTALHDLIRRVIREHKRIIFNGNSYDESWIKEATEVRGLLNLRTTPDVLPVILEKKNTDLLVSHKVMSESEIRSRYEITLENYCKTVTIEAMTMIDMTRKLILPAIEAYSASVAESLGAKLGVVPELSGKYEKEKLKILSSLEDSIDASVSALESSLIRLRAIDDVTDSAFVIRDVILQKMAELRVACDEAETLTAKKYWPFPTYGDLLFGVR